MSDVLNVFLHDRLIGTLTAIPGEKNLFAFTQDYIDDDNRPTLSLSFKDALGDLITDIPSTKIRVPPFFSNLLPEGTLREYLAAKAGVNAVREFHLLSILGQDLPGAITIKPVDAGTATVGDDYRNADRKLDDDRVLRFSLAGVQLKFSAMTNATGGLTIPANGTGGSWIVKFPSAKFKNVPENEYSMMTLAQRMGMDVPEVRLVDIASVKDIPEDAGQLGGTALIVKRFDRREGGQRTHIEDFAQVFGVFPDEKYRKATYRNIAEVVWTETGDKGITEFLRRLVFNTLIGNADMHLKNWSLHYPDQRHAMLAPGYDFVSTIVYLNDSKMALNLVDFKDMSRVSTAAMQRLAAKAHLPEHLVVDTATKTVQSFLDIWDSLYQELPLSRSMVSAIKKHFNTIEIVKEVRARR